MAGGLFLSGPTGPGTVAGGAAKQAPGTRISWVSPNGASETQGESLRRPCGAQRRQRGECSRTGKREPACDRGDSVPLAAQEPRPKIRNLKHETQNKFKIQMVK